VASRHRPGPAAAESPYSYWFACRRSALERRPVKLFYEWLFELSEPIWNI
jgi:hypothetical protein